MGELEKAEQKTFATNVDVTILSAPMIGLQKFKSLPGEPRKPQATLVKR